MHVLSDGNLMLKHHGKHLAKVCWHQEGNRGEVAPIPNGKYVVFRNAHVQPAIVSGDDTVALLSAENTIRFSHDALRQADAMIFEMREGEGPGQHQREDDVLAGMDSSTPASPYTESMRKMLESSFDTQEHPPSQASHSSAGLVAKVLAARQNISRHVISSSSGNNCPPKNKQQMALARSQELFDEFILDQWGPLSSTDTDALDIVGAIALIQHSICSTMTGGKANASDLLHIFLVRHGSSLRCHDNELFHYVMGYWRNCKECPHLDMARTCTIAEGLYHTLGKVVPEESAWNWPFVKAKLLELLARSAQAASFIEAAFQEARKDWDRIRRETKGRIYQADPLSKMADSVARNAKDFYENDLARAVCVDVLLPPVPKGQRDNPVIHIHNGERASVGRAPETTTVAVRVSVTLWNTAEGAAVVEVGSCVRVRVSVTHKGPGVLFFQAACHLEESLHSLGTEVFPVRGPDAVRAWRRLLGSIDGPAYVLGSDLPVSSR